MARSRRIVPIETPSDSPWTSACVKARVAGLSTRCERFRSASSGVRPRLCSRRASRSSWPSGPSMLRDASWRPAAKPTPPSTVVTSRSTSSGTSRSICSTPQAGATLHADVGQVPAHHDQQRSGEERPRVEPAAQREQDQQRQAGSGREDRACRRTTRPTSGTSRPSSAARAVPFSDDLRPVEARERALAGRRREPLERATRTSAGRLLDRRRGAEAVGRDLVERPPPLRAARVRTTAGRARPRLQRARDR